jgi:hypothetical protein
MFSELGGDFIIKLSRWAFHAADINACSIRCRLQVLCTRTRFCNGWRKRRDASIWSMRREGIDFCGRPAGHNKGVYAICSTGRELPVIDTLEPLSVRKDVDREWSKYCRTYICSLAQVAAVRTTGSMQSSLWLILLAD